MRIPNKIRGQKKLSKKIEQWRRESLKLDVSGVKERNYEYVKLWVQPLDNFRYHKRDYIGPKSGHRKQIIESFIDIYDSWKTELDTLNIPYYLKIWWYEPRITSSQVVCAIGDRINYYESMFESIVYKPPIDRYPAIASKILTFNWTSVIDEEIIENDLWPKDDFSDFSEYYKLQRYYRKLESSNVKKEERIEDEQRLVTYFVPKGKIFIGSRD